MEEFEVNYFDGNRASRTVGVERGTGIGSMEMGKVTVPLPAPPQGYNWQSVYQIKYGTGADTMARNKLKAYRSANPGTKFQLRTNIDYKGVKWFVVFALKKSGQRIKPIPTPDHLKIKPWPADRIMWAKEAGGYSLTVRSVADKLHKAGKKVLICKEMIDGRPYYVVLYYDPKGVALRQDTIPGTKYGESVSTTMQFKTKALAEGMRQKIASETDIPAEATSVSGSGAGPWTVLVRANYFSHFENWYSVYLAEAEKKRYAQQAEQAGENFEIVANTSTIKAAQTWVNNYRARGVASAKYTESLSGGYHLLVKMKHLALYEQVQAQFAEETKVRKEEEARKREAEKPIMVGQVGDAAKAREWVEKYKSIGIESAYYTYNPDPDAARAHRSYILWVRQKDITLFRELEAGYKPSKDRFAAFWKWLMSLFQVETDEYSGDVKITIPMTYGSAYVSNLTIKMNSMGIDAEFEEIGESYQITVKN